jgi:cytosine/uracil/thiamine/allantoin permease
MLTLIILVAAGGVVALVILWLVFSLVLHPASKSLSPMTLALSALAAISATGIAIWSIYKLCFSGEDDSSPTKTPKTTDSIWSNAKLEPRHSPKFPPKVLLIKSRHI